MRKFIIIFIVFLLFISPPCLAEEENVDLENNLSNILAIEDEFEEGDKIPIKYGTLVSLIKEYETLKKETGELEKDNIKLKNKNEAQADLINIYDERLESERENTDNVIKNLEEQLKIKEEKIIVLEDKVELLNDKLEKEIEQKESHKKIVEKEREKNEELQNRGWGEVLTDTKTLGSAVILAIIIGNVVD